MDPNQKMPYLPVYPSMPMTGQPQADPSSFPMQQQPPYQPQQQGMAPPIYDINQQPVITQQPTTTTVIMQQAAFGPDPQRLSCPHCKANIVSNVTSEATSKTHLIALLICCCFGSLGCCLIPYCVDSCQAQKHTCPNCGSYLGMHQ